MGKLYSLGRGGMKLIDQTNLLKIGTIVSYGDQANSRKNKVVVSSKWGHIGQRCITIDGSGETEVSAHSIERPGGWRLEEGILTADEILNVLEARKLYLATEEITKEAADEIRAEKKEKAILWQKENRPAWAKSVIVAEYVQDETDSQVDYFGHTTKACVFLAFSKHKRNLFPELRKAAARFKGTESMATPAPADSNGYKPGNEWYHRPSDEHVENWSIWAAVLS